MIDFKLEQGQHNVQQMARYFAESEARPRAIEADRTGIIDPKFLEKIFKMGLVMGVDSGGN